MKEELIGCGANNKSGTATIEQRHRLRIQCKAMDKNGPVIEHLHAIKIENLLSALCIDTLRVMSKLLRAYGQNVKTADTVQSAIACLDADPFDILISDIGLPDGTGLDVMRHAKSAQPSLKAIAVSGLGMEDDLRRSQEAGFHQHITKPVSIDKLLTAIDQLAAKTS